MPTPFPGADPYLERPSLWPDVHNRLIVLLADHLTPLLRPRYYAAIEERTYPLRSGDAEPEINLTALLHALYDRAGYDLRIDYRGEPDPPLVGADATWANALLRSVAAR